MKLDVEALIFHVSIDCGTRIPLSEIHAFTMSLANLDRQVKNREDSSLGSRLVLALIIISEVQLKSLLKETESLV